MNVPDFSLDERAPIIIEEPEDRPYLAVLATNPAWQALEEEIIERASGMIQQLLSLAPRKDQTREQFCAEIDTLRGKIIGVLTYLEEPVVIRRAIDARRDR